MGEGGDKSDESINNKYRLLDALSTNMTLLTSKF
jgi:hypothetical protein